MDSGDGGAESWQWNDPEGDSGGEGGDDEDKRTDGGDGPLARVRWFMRTDEERVVFVREVASSLAIVAAIGLILFAISGIWPPLVAVESGSMAPNLQIGDMVFIMEEHRLAGAAAINGTGIVPYKVGAAVDYKEFNKYGDVIVYHPYGNERRTPIIHRARFWVNEGENWYDEAMQKYLGEADNCKELANCPAEHAGFITKGDNNEYYDQVQVGYGEPISSPIKPKWIVGTAEFRIPWLGRIRLFFGRLLSIGTVGPVASVSVGSVSVL
jgi:signal peptidase